MSRTYRLEIPVTKEELQKIREKSSRYGLSASSFARLLLLNSKIEEFVINGKRKK